MYLIIGKNSRIVKDISNLLPDFEFLSHRDIIKTELTFYEKIFVFSWSHTNQKDNIQLLRNLDLTKVVFVSSIAVLACARRKQWASYPNNKLMCEKIVLEGGGKVIRVGVWDLNHLDDLSGEIPVTTPETLVATIYDTLKSPERVFWPIELRSGRMHGNRHRLNGFLNAISLMLPAKKFAQLPLVFCIKMFVSKEYGYTKDCLMFFDDRVIVGYGAVGSRVSQALTRKKIAHTIVMSDDENLFLNSRGFRGLRIGRYYEGLSKLWHGVWISNADSKYPRKNVPLFVRRPKAPRSTLIARASGVEFSSSLHNIKLCTDNVPETRLFAKKIHLAAGVINNVKILQSNFSVLAKFSDHEVGEVGDVKTYELVELGMISRLFKIVWGRRVIKGGLKGAAYLVDFRPVGPSGIGFDAENIYNNRTDQILRKLVNGLSFRMINQALFNKFGVAFDVGSFSAVVQAEASDAITLTEDGGLFRKRLPDIIFKEISTELEREFKSFKPKGKVNMFDAIHVHGGFDLDQHPEIALRIRKNELFLHGNVFDGSKLGPFHNTVSMINRELAVLADT